MRRAASNLGLGFAEKIKSRGLLCMRRSMGSLAAKRMSSESESPKLNKEKSLCLCFVERAGSYTSQVVRPVRLNSDDDDDDERGKFLPEEVAYNRSSDVYKCYSFCTLFGSQIVVPTGTDDRITHFSLIKFPNSDSSSSSKTKLHSFSSPKNKPLIGELNGKLYCIDNSPYLKSSHAKGLKESGFLNSPKHKLLPGESKSKPYCIPCLSSLVEEKSKKIDHSGDYTVVRAKLLSAEKLDRKVQPFEFLDAENINNLEWRPLDPPPFINGFSPNDFVVSFLEGSNKILGWEPDKAGVYCFDTTNPENGWTESSFSLANTLPFLVWNRRPPLFIRDHHPVLGDFHLMFIYDPIYSLVTSSFMSANCDDFRIIKYSPLQVPQFYDDLDPKLPISSIDFEFVHLGDRKVCLVLNKFFPHDHDQLKNTGILLVITFEYEFVPKIFSPNSVKYSKPIIYLSPRLLGTQRFRYHSRQLHKPGCTNTDSVRMSGVFLL